MDSILNQGNTTGEAVNGPLKGIRLLELAAFINGAGAGYMLGDLGAEVIKIEEPVRGDPARGVQQLWDRQMFVAGGLNITFETVNRNKKSITLNLKHEKSKDIIRRLVENSDVFYTNYSESVRNRLGLGYEGLSEYNPGIVYVVASGYGPKGEDRDKRAFDVLLQARSGLMFSCGDRDSSEPFPIVGGVVDQTGATMTAYAILVGLLAKERSGIGQEIHVSMLGTAIHMQALNVQTTLWRGRSMARHSRKRVRNPMSNHYRCEDDKWISLTEPQYDRFWDNICEIFGNPDELRGSKLATPDSRRENYQDLLQFLETTFAKKPRSEWIRIFREKAQFAFDVINDLSEAVADPQVLANNYVVDFNHAVLGDVKVTGVPFSCSKMEVGPRSRAPELGEHTEEVLLGMGFNWDQIVRLKDEGVI